MRITDEQLDNWFTYHPPTPAQAALYIELRGAAKDFAKFIVDSCPEGADTTLVVRKIREVVMLANQAIACGGK